jgi:putative ABC transport system permease protein
VPSDSCSVPAISLLDSPRTPHRNRAAPSARRTRIAAQFLSEAVLLAVIGGTIGTAIGSAITSVVARLRHWAPTLSPAAMWGGLAMALVIGTVAGLYPAVRAARLTPTDAPRAP